MMQRLRNSHGKKRDSQSRSGLTLYEVVLAFAIFLMSMAAISQMLNIGSRASVKAQLQSEAALLAEGKMAEVVAGFVPLAPSDNNVFSEDDPAWMWDMQVNEVSQYSAAGLQEVVITVRHANSAGEANVSYTIKRYLRDPAIFIEAANEAMLEAEENAEAESSSSSTTGGM